MAVHSFNTKVAKKYGVSEAVVLWNISYWQDRNRANEINFFDDRYWTFNSVKAYSDIFEYLSTKQISRILLKLEKEKAIVSGNYNEFGYDRTKWYSAEPFIMEMHGFDYDLPKREMDCTNTSNPLDKNVQSNLPKGKMDFTKRENGFSQMGKPIPDNKPNEKQDSDIANPSKKEFSFSYRNFNGTPKHFNAKKFQDEFAQPIEAQRMKCRRDHSIDDTQEFPKWVDAFMEDKAGFIFNDHNHVISSFKLFLEAKAKSFKENQKRRIPQQSQGYTFN